MKRNVITEASIRRMVHNTLSRVLRESMYDDDYNDYGDDDILTGKEDFENSGFEYEIRNRYPDKNLDITCDYDGTVTVTDLDTDAEYIGYGEVVYDTESLGHPDPRMPWREAEGRQGHFDFTDCLREIMAKIDADDNYK
jgi:hypothetical protein